MAYGLTKSLDLELSSRQYTTASDSASLSITGNMTIEGWIKLESGGDAQDLITKWTPTGNQRSYVVRINPTSGNVQLYVSSNGTAQGNANVAYSFSTGVWVHVAVVYTAASSQMELFIDGVSQGTANGTLPTSGNDNGSAVLVGAIEPEAPGAFLDGKISLLRIWSSARTGSEISANMCNVFGGATSNLSAEWSFDDVYTDASGNGNTLTPINSPVFSTDTPAICAVEEVTQIYPTLSMLGVG